MPMALVGKRVAGTGAKFPMYPKNSMHDPGSDNLPRIRDPRLLLLLRIAWIVCAGIALLVTVVSIPAYIRTCNCTPDVVAIWEKMGIAQGVRIVFTTLTAVNMLILLGLSALIAWRRPDDRMAMFVAFTSLVQGIFLVAGPAGSSAMWYFAVRMITNALIPLTWIGLLFLFPTGRFVPSWSRWLVLLLMIGILAAAVTPASAGPIRSVITAAAVFVGVVSLLVGLGGMIHRYRRLQTSIQRLQIKWTLFAIILMVTIMAIGISVQLLLHDRQAVATYTIFRHILFAIAQTLLPASIAFAMLRYRLYEIDIIIRRTLIYALLTVILALVYFGATVLTQGLFRLITGQTSDVAIVLSTLAIAVLFMPLHRRIQTAIDRRFYRRQYNSEQTLARFSTRVREEVDLDRLTGALIGVVQETIQPTYVSLWLREPAQKPANTPVPTDVAPG